jgi:hypothetical protein
LGEAIAGAVAAKTMQDITFDLLPEGERVAPKTVTEFGAVFGDHMFI